MLNVFEQHPAAHPIWIRLLQLFHAPPNTLCQVVGFKLNSFKVRTARRRRRRRRRPARRRRGACR